MVERDESSGRRVTREHKRAGIPCSAALQNFVRFLAYTLTTFKGRHANGMTLGDSLEVDTVTESERLTGDWCESFLKDFGEVPMLNALHGYQKSGELSDVLAVLMAPSPVFF